MIPGKSFKRSMVIYLCKGYVIFSFLKSRWSDNIEEFLNSWQIAADTGSKLTAGTQVRCGYDATCPPLAWDIRNRNPGVRGNSE